MTRRKNKEYEDFTQRTIAGKMDDILLRKHPIELKDMFENIEGYERKKVLMKGGPGCGKSVFSLHICCQWIEGKLFQ